MKLKNLYLLLLITFLFVACNIDTKWKGQKPIEKVSTQTVPVQLQYKSVYDLGNGIFLSNKFEGARLNGAALVNDTLVSVLITPENEPINASPWYAFKIWSNTERKISLKLNYTEKSFHRYFPKLSNDGIVWRNLDSSNYSETFKFDEEENKEVPKDATINLEIGTDTLWISAQELINPANNENWINELAKKSFVTKMEAGKSKSGKSINVLRISNTDDKKMMVVFSRQHPPEVTGYLAMRAFVETICKEDKNAENFRSKFTTYVIPMVNPDGVDNGHWRHNLGGVDLNRDWSDFNQPENKAIRDFLSKTIMNSDGKYYFAIDFHSTFEDIFYLTDSKSESNMPGFAKKWINVLGEEFDNYEPNIKSGVDTVGITSTSFMINEYGTESVTYEVGDNTQREFVKKKGETAALKLMELMTK